MLAAIRARRRLRIPKIDDYTIRELITDITAVDRNTEYYNGHIRAVSDERLCSFS